MRNSNGMEKEGFVRLLKRLMEAGLEINTISTDRHVQIRKMMRENEEYKNIKHVIDPWHVIKGLSKKIQLKLKTKKFAKLGK